LTITVRDRERVVAARTANDFGVFPDQSTNGPFDLDIINKAPKAEILGGSVTIRIDPLGEDTWRTDFFLDLVFDDASHLTAQAEQLSFSEKAGREQTFGIG
jgi:hypothetical protein